MGMIAQNPESIISQRTPGFLFASWPNFDPVFFSTHPIYYFYFTLFLIQLHYLKVKVAVSS